MDQESLSRQTLIADTCRFTGVGEEAFVRFVGGVLPELPFICFEVIVASEGLLDLRGRRKLGAAVLRGAANP